MIVSVDCAARGCCAHDSRVDGPGVVISDGALQAQVEYLTAALKDLLEMPEYDGTQTTSQIRLRAKNQAKRALKAVTT